MKQGWALLSGLARGGIRTSLALYSAPWSPSFSPSATSQAAARAAQLLVSACPQPWAVPQAHPTTIRAFATSAREDTGGSDDPEGPESKARQREAAVEEAVKDSLRRLYKLVHPDLFNDQVGIKAENERSFKLLQEYLQHSRSGDNRSPAARLPYHFVFFIRQQHMEQMKRETEEAAEGTEKQGKQEEGQGGAHTWTPPKPPGAGVEGDGRRAEGGQGEARQSAGASKAGGAGVGSETAGATKADAGGEFPGFVKVDVTLPPPQSESASKSKTLPKAARRALAKLLDACSIRPSIPLDSGGGAFSDGLGEGSALSLADFLPEATEALRQRQAGGADPGVRLANLRGAFRLGRQLLVSFPTDSALRSEQRVRLLERLAAILDSHPDLDLRGCRVLLGTAPTGIDRLGQLCLHQDEDARDWVAMLTQVDVDFALQRQRYVKAVKALEASVARVVGLLQVYTTPQHLPEPSYRAFLERLVSHAAGAGAVAGGDLRGGVAMCVLPSHVRHSPQGCPLGRPLEEACVVDANTGIVYLVDDLPALAVYQSVMRLGNTALRDARVHTARQADVEALSAKVRRALRLKRLMKDPVLARRDFESACSRLMLQADALAQVLDGSSLRIGFANRLAPDGSCIEIAWDFVD